MAKELKNLLVNHIHDSELCNFARQYLKGKMLDIGCGIKPYQDMLKSHVDEHVGLDHEFSLHDKSKVDLVGTAYDIPSHDASFDSAICTAVLEHLEEPERALSECFRVLKPGGIAIYSVPFIWHIHEEPRDFYRYSKYGLQYLFNKTGFEVMELKALSGFWVTMGQLLVYNFYRFNRGPLRWFHIIDAIALLAQGVAYVMDKADKAEHWTWMYMAVIKKPSSSQ